MPPLALSDAELDIVTNACAPCAPRIAAPFVVLSIELERERQLGPDLSCSPGIAIISRLLGE
jgi:hypothetical protein